MTDALVDIVRSGLRTYDLGRPLFNGMPQSPNHPRFTHTLARRHGDMVREDGGSAANDLLVMGTHVGTHIDAFSHVSHDGILHGGEAVRDAMEAGRFATHGVDNIEPCIRRGVLLDVAAALRVDLLPGGHEITVAELEATAERQRTRIGAGDVILVRAGWGQLFAGAPEQYEGAASGVPGVAEPGARWLAGHRPFAVGADSIAFERIPPGRGHRFLPAHRLLLVETGIHIIETLNLEEISAAGCYEFALVLIPLNIVGATGSPIRPLAVVTRD
jgi:kynurenine formamidase